MSINRLHARHERQYEGQRFVYPVLSRRSGGISVGVNLNPDKVCNFHCVYCQVNRRSQSETRFVDTAQLVEELGVTLDWVTSGRLFSSSKFRDTPAALRRLTDIAFSGDGEPTTHKNFDQVVEDCAAVKRGRSLDQLPMVLITNASMFHRDYVQRALSLLDAHHGEIWAKLDAGTEEHFKRVNRSPLSLQHIVDNIAAAAIVRPIVIQSLFMRLGGLGPPAAERIAFCERLREITRAGGRIRLVQIYTVARPPAEADVSALTDGEVDELVEMVRARTGLEVAGYYGIAQTFS